MAGILVLVVYGGIVLLVKNGQIQGIYGYIILYSIGVLSTLSPFALVIGHEKSKESWEDATYDLVETFYEPQFIHSSKQFANYIRCLPESKPYCWTPILTEPLEKADLRYQVARVGAGEANIVVIGEIGAKETKTLEASDTDHFQAEITRRIPQITKISAHHIKGFYIMPEIQHPDKYVNPRRVKTEEAKNGSGIFNKKTSNRTVG